MVITARPLSNDPLRRPQGRQPELARGYLLRLTNPESPSGEVDGSVTCRVSQSSSTPG